MSNTEEQKIMECVVKCCDGAEGCDECCSQNECADCCSYIHEDDVTTTCAGECEDCGKQVCADCWDAYYETLTEEQQDELDGNVRCANCRDD